MPSSLPFASTNGQVPIPNLGGSPSPCKKGFEREYDPSDLQLYPASSPLFPYSPGMEVMQNSVLPPPSKQKQLDSQAPTFGRKEVAENNGSPKSSGPNPNETKNRLLVALLSHIEDGYEMTEDGEIVRKRADSLEDFVKDLNEAEEQYKKSYEAEEQYKKSSLSARSRNSASLIGSARSSRSVQNVPVEKNNSPLQKTPLKHGYAGSPLRLSPGDLKSLVGTASSSRRTPGSGTGRRRGSVRRSSQKMKTLLEEQSGGPEEKEFKEDTKESDILLSVSEKKDESSEVLIAQDLDKLLEISDEEDACGEGVKSFMQKEKVRTSSELSFFSRIAAKVSKTDVTSSLAIDASKVNLTEVTDKDCGRELCNEEVSKLLSDNYSDGSALSDNSSSDDRTSCASTGPREDEEDEAQQCQHPMSFGGRGNNEAPRAPKIAPSRRGGVLHAGTNLISFRTLHG